jgi:hypothetical protein
MIIDHASVKWEDYIPKKVNTLVLGSFNPNNPGNNANYYYGRKRNYFWKSLGGCLQNNDHHFFIQGQLNNDLVFQCMEENGFYFFDLIHELNLNGINQEHEINFRNTKIYSGFNDSVLFTNNTNFQNNLVNIQRSYNQNIIDFIYKYKPKTLIHTLGNATINANFESQIGDLNNFLTIISNACDNSNTEIVELSISPSQYNIHYFGLRQQLNTWLHQNLIL